MPPPPSPAAPPPIRLLILAANPDSTTPLHVGREVRRIRERIAGAAHRSALDIVERWAVRAADLQQALIEAQPHIVHFSGHGNADDELLLEDDGGSPRPVSKAVLTELFRLRGAGVRLVVLSACHSLPQAEVLVSRWNIAILLLQRDAPGDREEARELLRLAGEAATAMGVPEAAAIRSLQERAGLEPP